MLTFTGAQLLAACQGTFVSAARADNLSYRVTTDTRELHASPSVAPSAFVALTGARFDGHDFILHALTYPDVAVIAEREKLAALRSQLPLEHLIIAVEDSLVALGNISASIRNLMRIPVVAITGSAGKTTTKDLVRAILTESGPGLATEGNFNNLVGVPLTLLRWFPDAAWAVLELGMNQLGEIERLATITRPTIRLITNIGAAHTEGVGGVEGVAKAKGELFTTANPGDVLVLNRDDERIMNLPRPPGIRAMTFGRHPDAEVRLVESQPKAGGGSCVTVSTPAYRLDVETTLFGPANSLNVTAAIAIASALDIHPDHIRAGLADPRIAPMRMQRIGLRDAITVINDAYNANPVSMNAALNTLTQLAEPTHRRTIAVLGDMLELGTHEQPAHFALGKDVVEQGIDRLLVCGARAAAIREGAMAAGMDPAHIFWSLDHSAVAEKLAECLRPADLILVKGSRGSRMEKVLDPILREFTASTRGPETEQHAEHTG